MKDIINKNHEGDCIEIMSNMPKGKANLILTDPPYNASNGGVNLPNNKTGGAYYKVNEKWDKFSYEGYMDFTKKWIDEADKLLVPNGSFMVCGSLHNIGEVIVALKDKGYKFVNLITWKKTNPMPNITRSQGAERIKGENGKSAHPTQKPLELFKRLIEMATDEGEIIVDPFIGSGTTAIASMQLNRNWVGIDKDKSYIDLANKRINNHQKNTKLKEFC